MATSRSAIVAVPLTRFGLGLLTQSTSPYYRPAFRSAPALVVYSRIPAVDQRVLLSPAYSFFCVKPNGRRVQTSNLTSRYRGPCVAALRLEASLLDAKYLEQAAETSVQLTFWLFFLQFARNCCLVHTTLPHGDSVTLGRCFPLSPVPNISPRGDHWTRASALQFKRSLRLLVRPFTILVLVVPSSVTAVRFASPLQRHDPYSRYVYRPSFMFG